MRGSKLHAQTTKFSKSNRCTLSPVVADLSFDRDDHCYEPSETFKRHFTSVVQEIIDYAESTDRHFLPLETPNFTGAGGYLLYYAGNPLQGPQQRDPLG